MQHAYAALILRRMRECGYDSNEALADAAGISGTRIGEIVNDDRPSITRMPPLETVRKLARALRTSTDELLLAAAEAYGVPVTAPVTVYSTTGAQDSDLARELMTRAMARESAGTPPPLDLSGMARGAAQSIGGLHRSLLDSAAATEDDNPDLARAQRHLADMLQDALERAAKARSDDE